MVPIVLSPTDVHFLRMVEDLAGHVVFLTVTGPFSSWVILDRMIASCLLVFGALMSMLGSMGDLPLLWHLFRDYLSYSGYWLTLEGKGQTLAVSVAL